MESTILVERFAVNFDAINDRNDGSVDRDLFQSLSRTSGASLTEENELAFASTHGVDTDDGIQPVFEFRRILVVDEFRTHEEKFPSHHVLVLLGRDNLPDDFC